MVRGILESAGWIYGIFVVAAIVLVAWALVMVIRVAHRWLRLHPVPPRGERVDRSDDS